MNHRSNALPLFLDFPIKMHDFALSGADHGHGTVECPVVLVRRGSQWFIIYYKEVFDTFLLLFLFLAL